MSKTIRQMAEEEIEQELLREAIDKMKEKIKSEKWYHKLFPYKIVLVRREK